MTAKPSVDTAAFAALDIRVGKIIGIEEAQTNKPTYRLTIDCGPEIGTKISCAGYRNYEKEYLLGKEVVCVVNLPPKKMGPETSDVLVLGVTSETGSAIFLRPDTSAPLGANVF